MYLYNNKQFKTAEDLQDEIYRNMSVDKKMQVASGLWQLGKALNSDKIDYRKIYDRNNRPARSAGASRKNSG